MAGKSHIGQFKDIYIYIYIYMDKDHAQPSEHLGQIKNSLRKHWVSIGVANGFQLHQQDHPNLSGLFASSRFFGVGFREMP